MVKQLTPIAGGVLVLIAAAVTDGAAGPQSQCLVGKNKCVAKKAGSLLTLRLLWFGRWVLHPLPLTPKSRAAPWVDFWTTTAGGRSLKS
jgi:hypothetical protein